MGNLALSSIITVLVEWRAYPLVIDGIADWRGLCVAGLQIEARALG